MMGGGKDGGGAGAVAPQTDPTPLAKCKVAANSSNPLVTEWPASEKAHLQSLAAKRVVAVEYSGCELNIVDACELPGGYDWHRTTLATDQIEIDNADELFAKLPLGAFALEGELERSGRLAVRTTVAGQLVSKAPTDAAVQSAACARATHYVSAISVGAFQLLSGSSIEGGGQVGVAGVGAGARGRNKEVVLREAGVGDTCPESSDEAPHTQCASPIQVFLQPLGARSPQPMAEAGGGGRISDSRAVAEGGVHIAFESPDPEEVWTLRDARSQIICQVPCEAVVPPVSGYYLQRQDDGYELRLPKSFPHRPGAKVSAEFQEGRGNPFLSALTFYGVGISASVMGVVMITWGAIQLGCKEDPDDPSDDCFPPGGFLLGSGIMFAGMGIASYWWFNWSQEEEFETKEVNGGGLNRGLQIGFGPGGISGIF